MNDNEVKITYTCPVCGEIHPINSFDTENLCKHPPPSHNAPIKKPDAIGLIDVASKKELFSIQIPKMLWDDLENES